MDNLSTRLGYLMGVAVLLFLVDCRSLVPADFDGYRKAPVMNAIIAAGEPVCVSLSWTAPLGADGIEELEDVAVSLLVDGVPTAEMVHDTGGLYLSGITAREGRTYRIEADVPGFGTVAAQSTLPRAGQILDVVSVPKAGIDSEGTAYPALEITFTNNPDLRSYYEVVIRLSAYGEERSADIGKIVDPLLQNEGLPLALFSNELITGDAYRLTLNYTTGSVSSAAGSAPEYELFPLVVELRTVSREYYEYARRLYLYNEGRYPDGIGTSATAVPLYFNVTNGHGIVAAYSSSVTDTIQP